MASAAVRAWVGGRNAASHAAALTTRALSLLPGTPSGSSRAKSSLDMAAAALWTADVTAIGSRWCGGVKHNPAGPSEHPLDHRRCAAAAPGRHLQLLTHARLLCERVLHPSSPSLSMQTSATWMEANCGHGQQAQGWWYRRRASAGGLAGQEGAAPRGEARTGGRGGDGKLGRGGAHKMQRQRRQGRVRAGQLAGRALTPRTSASPPPRCAQAGGGVLGAERHVNVNVNGSI